MYAWGDGGGTGITPLILNLSTGLYCTFFNVSIFGEGMFQTPTILSRTNTVLCPLDGDGPATHQFYQVNQWTQLILMMEADPASETSCLLPELILKITMNHFV